MFTYLPVIEVPSISQHLMSIFFVSCEVLAAESERQGSQSLRNRDHMLMEEARESLIL